MSVGAETIDPSAKVALCRALEGTIRQALRYDPGTSSALGAVSGKVLAIICTQPRISLYFVCHPVEFQVLSHYEERAECQIEGAMGPLMALLWSETDSLADSGVTISGEVGFLLQLKRLLSQVDIDWEQPICDLLGDSIGYPLAQVIRRQFEWARQRSQVAPMWLSDMLLQEWRATPSRVELENFYTEVDSLRSGADRVQAQVALIRRRLAAHKRGDHA